MLIQEAQDLRLRKVIRTHDLGSNLRQSDIGPSDTKLSNSIRFVLISVMLLPTLKHV